MRAQPTSWLAQRGETNGVTSRPPAASSISAAAAAMSSVIARSLSCSDMRIRSAGNPPRVHHRRIDLAQVVGVGQALAETLQPQHRRAGGADGRP